MIVLNNGGVYCGDGVNTVSADPSPTTSMPQARDDRLDLAGVLRGKGAPATTPPASPSPSPARCCSVAGSFLHCVIDPEAPDTRSGSLPSHSPQPDPRREEMI